MRVHRKAWALLGIATGWAALTLFALGFRLEAELAQSLNLIAILHMLGFTFTAVSLLCIFAFERHRWMQLLLIGTLFGSSMLLGHIEHYKGIVLRHQCVLDADWRICAKAANYHAARSEFSVHRQAAGRYWTKACQHGGTWETCRRANESNGLEFGYFCERTRDACHRGVERACNSMPLGCEVTPNLTEASACRDGDPEACYEAGRVLEERDQERARSYILRACEAADSVEELDACFDLVDRGHRDSRRIACEQILQECHFRPNQPCRAYVERCNIVTRSPYDRGAVRIAR